MRIKGLPWLAGGWLSLMFIVFGSHGNTSLFRWVFGFYWPLSIALIIVGSWLWEYVKGRHRIGDGL
jgi:hypothetical protein